MKIKRTKGKVKNALPTTYNEIKFRSRLEVFTYKQLCGNFDVNNIRYEDEKFILQPAFKFRDECIRLISYTPDFLVTHNQKISVIECKGFLTDAATLKLKMFKKYLVDNNLNYDFYMPRNQKNVIEIIEQIKNKI